jgi:hypothetical protein
LTEMAKNLSSDGSQSRHDPNFPDGASGGDSGTAETGEVVAIGSGDTLDQAQNSQPFELARERGRAEVWEQGMQVSTAHAADVELGPLQCPQQGLLAAFEEVQSLDGSVFLSPVFTEPVQRPDAGRFARLLEGRGVFPALLGCCRELTFAVTFWDNGW